MDYYIWAVAEFVSPTALAWSPKLHPSDRQKELLCVNLHLVISCAILSELPLKYLSLFSLVFIFPICLNSENLNHICWMQIRLLQHTFILSMASKKILPVKILAIFIFKNDVLLSVLGQRAAQASFGKMWQIISCCLFCSEKHSVLDSLPRRHEMVCYSPIAHTEQWTVFVKLAALQWINFMPRGERGSVAAPNKISQAREVGVWLWWHTVWGQVRSIMANPTSAVSSPLEWEAADGSELFHGHLNPTFVDSVEPGCW